MEHILSEEDKQALEKLMNKIKPEWKHLRAVIGSLDPNPRKTYLDFLSASKGQDLIIGIKGNKLKFFRGDEPTIKYDSKGSKGAGVDVLLSSLIEILSGTLECNIELFSICFKIELKEAIKKVLDRYNVEVIILE